MKNIDWRFRKLLVEEPFRNSAEVRRYVEAALDAGTQLLRSNGLCVHPAGDSVTMITALIIDPVREFGFPGIMAHDREDNRTIVIYYREIFGPKGA